jgi:hypothetical protein
MVVGRHEFDVDAYDSEESLCDIVIRPLQSRATQAIPR